MIEDVIYQLLSQTANINSEVDGRIYSLLNKEENETDYIVYKLIANTRNKTATLEHAGSTASFEISVYSKSETNKRQIANIVIDELDDLMDSAIAPSIQLIEFESEISNYDETDELFGSVLIFNVYY